MFITVEESCKNGNFLTESTESEFLFAPHSVFTVIEMKKVYPEPFETYEYEIHVKAADDKCESQELPLSIWH